MKASPIHAEHGLTRLEVTILIVVIVGLGFMFLSALSGAKGLANYSACVNHLKDVGLALRTFSTDNGGLYPMEVSVTNGGTREWLTDETQLWRHWRTVTNGLASPKFLLCPGDRRRQPSFITPEITDWHQLTNNSRLSYFLGLGMSEEDPESIISGDRNLIVDGLVKGAGRLVLLTNMAVGFSAEIHREVGNMLYADGRVDQLRIKTLDSAWFAAQTNSRAVPKVWLVP